MTSKTTLRTDKQLIAYKSIVIIIIILLKSGDEAHRHTNIKHTHMHMHTHIKHRKKIQKDYYNANIKIGHIAYSTDK